MSDGVVIVDDSLTVRMDLADAFSAAGFKSFPCASLQEAKTALEQTGVRVAILDVLLPDGDGIDLLKAIRAQNKSIVVLMLSSETDVKDRMRGLQTGADEYIGKPYDAGYVVAKARELLRLRHVSVAHRAASVLIIDDSVTYREALREAMSNAGYEVLVAASGEDGLRIAADRRPSAVIVDGVLPGMDGSGVIRRIRLDSALRGTPCLMLTGSEDRGAELRALDAGADTFVRKEEDMETVLAKLSAALRRPQVFSAGDTVSLAGPRKVLAVDDSQTYLQQLSETLRGEGFDVIQARSGEEAIELLAVQPVDCILLDLVMPGLSGTETCQRIKSAPVVREIPVVMLTAVEDRKAMFAALGAGADDYISKSSELDVLKARVRTQIRRKQFEDENRHIREELLRKELEAAEARAARELAETRARLAEELEMKNRELETFSYTVSHDLRSPLRAIDGFAAALWDDYHDKVDEQAQEYIRRVRAGAQRMGQLIDDLLHLAHIGRGELDKRPVDLSAIARDIVSDLRARAPQRQAVFTVADGLATVGDDRLLRVVLENLLGNAWKFTGRKKVSEIEVGACERESKRAFYVRDNGAGFDMSYASKLFGPFQRLHAVAEFEGNGIGLATVHRVITRHGGKVWAEAAIDKGTTIYFSIG